MTMTQFLTKYASNRFASIDDLYQTAKAVGFLKSSERGATFTALLEAYLNKHRKTGTMPNGRVFYLEIKFRGRLSVRVGGRNCGLIKVGRPMRGQEHDPNPPAGTDRPKHTRFEFAGDPALSVKLEGYHHFQRYVRGYFRDEPNMMTVGWLAFVKAVGKPTAIEVFWGWQHTLPVRYRSDVDPEGN